MARRILDTAFWDDSDIASLNYPERLLFSCMVTNEALSDDYGHLPAHPAILKKHAFGYDSCSVEEVEGWRNNILEKCRNVRLYSVNGQEYIELCHFDKWQKLRYRRRTNIPPPLEDSRNISQDSETLQKVSHGRSCSSSGLGCVGLGCVGLGSVVEGGDGLGCVGIAPATAPEKEPLPPPAFQQAVAIWEDMTGKITDRTRQQFSMAADEYGEERLLYAVQEAHDHNVKSWAYVEAILDGKPRNKGSPDEVSWEEIVQARKEYCHDDE